MIYVKISLGLLLIVGAYILFWRGLQKVLAEEKERSRAPFKEKILRPAGESLRLKIEGIRDRMMQEIVVLTGAMLFPGIVVLIPGSGNWVSNLIVWAASIAIGAWVGLRSWKKMRELRKELRQHRLGFEGERYVAEKLAGLTSYGYRVFHDFLFDMKAGGETTNFNIDHIVVGPTGIFVIETKTYRQPNGHLRDAGESHRIRSDGDSLILPGGIRRRKPLGQVRKNTEELAKWLTGSSPRKQAVFPVLAMPGWYTDEDTIPDILVLNPQRLVKRLSEFNRHGRISAEEVQRIGDRIEAQCRNVDIE